MGRLRVPERDEFAKQGPSVGIRIASTYTKVAVERPGHYPRMVRQAWQMGKDGKPRKKFCK